MDSSAYPSYILPYESALEASPQILSVIETCEKNADDLKDFLLKLRQISEDIAECHAKLNSSYQDLSSHLTKFKEIENVSVLDPDGVARCKFKEMSAIFSQISSFEHIIAGQVSDTVVYPLCKYVDSDLIEINTLSELYKCASNDVDRSLARYGRLRQKDNQQERHEATEEVYRCRKRCHQIALQFYGRLNQVQTSGQLAGLKPVLGLLTSLRGYFKLGSESLVENSTNNLISDVGKHLKTVSDDLTKERLECEALIKNITSQSQFLYYPYHADNSVAEPSESNTKSGYLNVHRKYMGVMSSWERQYTYIHEGHLMTLPKGETTPVFLVKLDPSTVSHASDTDDRMHVFTVSTASKSAILQALNDKERDEWIMTVLIHSQMCSEESLSSQKPGSSSLLAGVGNFFAGKIQAAVSSGAPGAPTPSDRKSVSPTPLRDDVIPKDAPICFDLLSSDDDVEYGLLPGMNGKDEVKTFSVRFLGSMNVKMASADAFMMGQPLVYEVMRRILEARAVHNLFTTSHINLSITPTSLLLQDPQTNGIKNQQSLRDITFWAAHNENERLVGYIVKEESSTPKGLSCYVFESDCNGKHICSALGSAARMTYAQLLDQTVHQKKKKEETRLLLQNIAMLPDLDSPVISHDGSAVVLEEAIIEKPKTPSPTKRPESDA